MFSKSLEAASYPLGPVGEPQGEFCSVSEEEGDFKKGAMQAAEMAVTPGHWGPGACPTPGGAWSCQQGAAPGKLPTLLQRILLRKRLAYY